jgi:EAL domain-containing protein (putative c-di-GMP-specific phosphodiesterase class I)
MFSLKAFIFLTTLHRSAYEQIAIPVICFLTGIAITIIVLKKKQSTFKQSSISEIKHALKHMNIEHLFLYIIELNQLNKVSECYHFDLSEKLLQEAFELLNTRYKYVFLIENNHILVCEESFNKVIINRKLRYDEQWETVQLLKTLINSYKFQPEINGQHLNLSCTIGSASVGFKNRPDHIEGLIQLARYSLNRAKHSFTSVFIATDETILIKEDTDEFYRELEQGLQLNEFNPYFQPIINPTTREIIGCESLMRWEKNGYRIIEAKKFIEIAREKNAIQQLDIQIIKESLKKVSNWKTQQIIHQNFQITINVDIHTIKQLQVHELISIINEYNISPEQIEIDIGEHDLEHDLVYDLLKKLKEYGFHLALDTSTSPFRVISALSDGLFNTIKFNSKMIVKPDRLMIDTLFVNLFEIIQKQNIKVIIKGVEKKREFDMFARLKVNGVQGNYIAPALNNHNMKGFLQKYTNNKVQ